MSDSTAVKFRYIKEDSLGTLPGTPSNIFSQVAGLTAFNKGSAAEHSRPTIKRGDYMPGKLRRTRASSAPSLEAALIYGDLDPFMEAAFRSAWATDVLIPGDPATGTFDTFSTEEEFTDEPTQELAKVSALGVAGMAFSFPLNGEVSASVDFFGRMPESIPASEADSVNPPVTGEVMAGLDVANINIDGGAFGGCVQQIDLTWASPVVGRWCLGAGLDPQRLRYDPFALGATLTLYNSPEGHALWKKMVDPSLPVIALVFDVVDSVSGSKYTFDAQALKATAGDHEWNTEDVLIPLELEGDDPGNGELLKITRAA